MSASYPSPTTDPAEALRRLLEFDAQPKRPPVRVPHPAPGCSCDGCTARDDRLEHIAEERAHVRRFGS